LNWRRGYGGRRVGRATVNYGPCVVRGAYRVRAVFLITPMVVPAVCASAADQVPSPAGRPCGQYGRWDAGGGTAARDAVAVVPRGKVICAAAPGRRSMTTGWRADGARPFVFHADRLASISDLSPAALILSDRASPCRKSPIRLRVKVLRSARRKIGHFEHVLSSHSIGLVLTTSKPLFAVQWLHNSSGKKLYKTEKA